MRGADLQRINIQILLGEFKDCVKDYRNFVKFQSYKEFYNEIVRNHIHSFSDDDYISFDIWKFEDNDNIHIDVKCMREHGYQLPIIPLVIFEDGKISNRMIRYVESACYCCD